MLGQLSMRGAHPPCPPAEHVGLYGQHRPSPSAVTATQLRKEPAALHTAAGSSSVPSALGAAFVQISAQPGLPFWM